ncbi:MAG: DUF362 domain-containing protein, partial [Eubacteriales bacterium]|nr:DUF362 domain-containing protein [Eubacteriales bacterium]
VLIGNKKNVAVKPNLVLAKASDECVTTHPAVVQSVLEAVVDSGRCAKIAESPGGPYARPYLQAVYQATGIAKAAKSAGAELNDDLGYKRVYLKNGQAVKTMRIIKPVLDADSVISVAKLKTHGMMTYSGAVKNLFGVVPGISKPECHFRLPAKEDFARMIVDIAEFIKPDFCVIDAVWAMEGNGPTAGNRRKVGAIIVSDCPYAADIVAGHIIGLDWRDNPVIKNAADRGLCREQDIEMLGDGIDDLIVADFVMPEVHGTNLLRGRVPKLLERILTKRLVLYPKFNDTKCVGCGICAKNCPNKAITMRNNRPDVNMRKCINCFCCHELCPQKAVEIHKPFILRAAIRIFK